LRGRVMAGNSGSFCTPQTQVSGSSELPVAGFLSPCGFGSGRSAAVSAHRCAPQNYSGDGQGHALRRLLRPVGSGPEHRAIVPWLFCSSSRRCEVASSSTPVLLRVDHSTAAAGNPARRSGLVERASTRTVTEGLGSVVAPTRIPLINNHVDRHPASPDATPALLLEGSRGESPMTALAIDRQRRWHTAPRRWRGLVLTSGSPTFNLLTL
jgi:hypothetical protein